MLAAWLESNVGLSDLHFGPNWSLWTAIGWTAMFLRHSWCPEKLYYVSISFFLFCSFSFCWGTWFWPCPPNDLPLTSVHRALFLYLCFAEKKVDLHETGSVLLCCLTSVCLRKEESVFYPQQYPVEQCIVAVRCSRFLCDCRVSCFDSCFESFDSTKLNSTFL